MADGELNVDGLISRLLEGKFAVLFEKEEPIHSQLDSYVLLI